MTTTSRARRCIDLRESYDQRAIALYFQPQFESDRAERQAIGRRKTLEALANALTPVYPGMKPANVGELVLRILYQLAEDKMTWLVNSIKRRRQFHINELGEYTAEGAIAQIDEVTPELLAVLAPRSGTAPQLYGRFFQVYRQVSSAEQCDRDLWQQRWFGESWGDWFHEVVILSVGQPELPLERLTQALCHTAGERPTVHWLRQGMSNAIPVPGDIIVSMLSGHTWFLNETGLEAFEHPAPGAAREEVL